MQMNVNFRILSQWIYFIMVARWLFLTNVIQINTPFQEFCEGQAYLKKIYKDFYWTLDDTQRNPIVTYTNRCVELAWWMCVQDPPIYMDVMESTVIHAFNVATYKAYTKTGKTVEYYVWPALLLENGGAVFMKGVAQCQRKTNCC